MSLVIYSLGGDTHTHIRTYPHENNFKKLDASQFAIGVHLF